MTQKDADAPQYSNTAPGVQNSAPALRASMQSTIVAAAVSIGLLIAVWYIFDVLLLVFAAILIAIILRSPSDWIARKTSLSAGWALAVVVLTTIGLFAIAAWLLGRAVLDQFNQLTQQVPQFIDSIRSQLGEYGWIVGQVKPRGVISGQGALGRGLDVISATFGVIASVGIVVLMALFFAAQPKLYVSGSVKLLPIRRRQRVRDMLEQSGHTLQRWILGQLFLMSLVAITTVSGLYLLDVQYALALGLLAGALAFVPFLGPLIAALLAVLVALAESPTLALYVAALYAGVQILEGVLEPLVQQRAVYLPPVLLLFSQVVLGIFGGLLGVVLATPLAAAVMVAVRMLYIEDVLGDV